MCVGFEVLSERESELLPYITAGWSGAEIGKYLCITERTVRTHTANILDKLQLSNRTEIAALCLLTGVVPSATAWKLFRFNRIDYRVKPVRLLLVVEMGPHDD